MSAQKVTGFFGLLEVKKKSDLCAKVLQEISLNHPVVSGTFNVCDLVRSDKLKRLTIDELTQICSDLEVNLSDLPSKRRKKPFNQRLQKLVEECSCGQNT